MEGQHLLGNNDSCGKMNFQAKVRENQAHHYNTSPQAPTLHACIT